MSVKSTSVNPLPIVTTTLLEVLLPPRSGGSTVMFDTTTSWGTISVTVTGVLTGNEPTISQEPPGGGPAGIWTGAIPVTLKVNSVPIKSGEPAILQIFNVPGGAA